MHVSKPTFVVVDDREAVLQRIERELHDRYGTNYDMICESSALAALDTLAALKTAGTAIPILFADLWMPEMTGIDFLKSAHELLPATKRVLLIEWGDRDARAEILPAITFGWIDHFYWKPYSSPDERFHRFITEMLDDWQRVNPPDAAMVNIVGERWTARAYEIRDLLNRFSMPFNFFEAASPEGTALLQRSGVPQGPFPVVMLLDDRVLTDPSDAQITDAMGITFSPATEAVDLVIVGAGPAGLSASVYGASEGLNTLVIERHVVGGQAGSSSLIRNYLGFPNGVSGGEMAKRAYAQAWLFGANFYLLHDAVNLRVDGNRRVVVLSDGTEIVTKAVVLAMGVTYRRLQAPKLEALLGKGVFYGSTVTEARAMTGQKAFIAGAGNSAGQAALHLARYAAEVTLVVRGQSLGASMSEYLIRQIEATANITVLLNTEIIDGDGDGHLEGLVLRDNPTGATRTVEAAALFVLIGAAPCTEWLPPSVVRDSHGFIVTGQDMLDCDPSLWTLERPPARLETSIPGVFTAGDARFRSIKRVAAAVGEGGTVISLVHEYLSTLPD
jgi:thioredoxin reductase (NADPH)